MPWHTWNFGTFRAFDIANLCMAAAMTWRLGMFALILAIGACDKATGPDIEVPSNLIYTLEPSGDPKAPAGLLLQWDGVTDDRLTEYRVYSRASDGARYDLRASTTSASFHDEG
jgi:hypothetical protein